MYEETVIDTWKAQEIQPGDEKSADTGRQRRGREKKLESGDEEQRERRRRRETIFSVCKKIPHSSSSSCSVENFHQQEVKGDKRGASRDIEERGERRKAWEAREAAVVAAVTRSLRAL